MDRQRAAPSPAQGNICPFCYAPHFPFCSPNPNPRFPAVQNPLNMQTQPPVSAYAMLDPFHPPQYWERNPNSNAIHSQYHHIQPPSAPPGNAANHARGGYFYQGADYRANAIETGRDCYGMNDRSSKRLKMDGTHFDSHAANPPAMPVSCEDERRLKLIHEHGRAMNGLAPNGQCYYDGRTDNTLVESNHTLGSHHTALAGHPDQTKSGYGVASHLKDSYPKVYATSHYAIPQSGSHYTPTEEFDVQPPLPSTPPPLPPELPPSLDMPGQWMPHLKHSPAPSRSSFPFPPHFRSSTPAHSMYLPTHSLVPGYPHISQPIHSDGGLYSKDSQGPKTAMYLHTGQVQANRSNHNVSDMSKIIDALSLFKPPNRDRRPDHFVIILRGLPGSGKSYLAKVLRDLEVENGGKAPRIHSMDDYFMTEVEKVEENETSMSSGRGKKQVIKKVLEYCYEPEMEEAYRSSMLKAFKKTLDEGSFTFIIVDDRNLRVADFAQFWATAKRSGYEVYLLEASYKDPVGCTARNIHGFTRDDIEKMAKIWEEAPSLYLQLNAKSLSHGENSKESNIREVDMDMDDEDPYKGSSESEERKQENLAAKTSEKIRYDDSKKTWTAEADHPDEEVKDLRCSKWSGDLDEDNAEGSYKTKYKSTGLSGSFQAYEREGKSVHWGDQTPDTGFSIGAMAKANAASLVIGPGSGYNLKSNPLPVEELHLSVRKGEDLKKNTVFQEHLRAEKESFKAVFDRRRQRIGGLGLEED